MTAHFRKGTDSYIHVIIMIQYLIIIVIWLISLTLSVDAVIFYLQFILNCYVLFWFYSMNFYVLKASRADKFQKRFKLWLIFWSRGSATFAYYHFCKDWVFTFIVTLVLLSWWMWISKWTFLAKDVWHFSSLRILPKFSSPFLHLPQIPIFALRIILYFTSQDIPTLLAIISKSVQFV